MDNNALAPNAAAATPEQRQARLIGLQDEDGYHLCIGFIKAVSAEGAVTFEEQGQKVLTYGTYETAIQDLENCLTHVKAMLAAKQNAPMH